MSDGKIPPPPVPNIPKPPKYSSDYKKPQNILGGLMKMKIPPQAIDLEEAVLGALMIDKKGIEEVINIMLPEFFYKEQHQRIYTAIKTLYDSGVGIDLLTLSNELKRKSEIEYIGGEYYLIQLTQKVSSSAHIEFHCRIIIQKYVLRQLMANAQHVTELAYEDNPDIFDLMDLVTANIDRIYKHAIIKDINSDSSDAKSELSKRREMTLKGESPGNKTGISDFDDWCGGFQPRELITIAARPGMGKTSIGIAMMCNSALDINVKTAFFSLEMSQIDVKNRIAARLTSVPYSKIRMANLNDEEYIAVLTAFDYIDKSNLSVHDILEHNNRLDKIIKLIKKLVSQGVKQIFLDYVQLIKLLRGSGNRTEDLNTITRELKALANELNIPIIQFAQLNRSVDQRTGHRPTLADLKQSGSIEEDSDTVIFILRDAYYKEQSQSGIEIPPHIAGDTWFIVAKGRSIGTRTFRVMLDFFKYSVVSYSGTNK